MPFTVTIIANKSNPYGISKDVEAVRRAFGGRGAQIRVSDPLEPPVYSDIAVHLEIPIYVWMPWAATNILMVNPEWFVEEAWRPYLSRFDAIVVKDSATFKYFSETLGLDASKLALIPWGLPECGSRKFAKDVANEFIWVLGASKSKRAYVPVLLAAWRPEYPRLTITAVAPLDLSGVAVPANVSIRVGDMDKETREKLIAKFRGHVCCSMAEGFGYTAAEAEDLGAFAILNSLPVYSQDYFADLSGTSFLPAALKTVGPAHYDTGVAAIQDALDGAIGNFMLYTEKASAARRQSAKRRWAAFTNAWAALYEPMLGRQRPAAMDPLPPALTPEECPPISVVTLVYNRKRFWDLVCHNIMITDYPKDKIEWIVVDDSDDPAEQNTDRIVATLEAATPIRGVYVPKTTKRPVSEKRSIGVYKASNPIVLFMDDDDHYPPTSFRRRVSWLVKHPWQPKATACTTIACYDLQKGISAVNQPPMDIPLGQRISEATLTFYRSWWEEKKFPAGVVVGEGEEFVAGRESDLLELPPQQIIVAFSHGRNVSSRRVPSDAGVKPGCFWGFPKEYLEFIHGLAGVKVVAGNA
jgi:hypothetical protein